MDRKVVGKKGEDAAAKYLCRLGYAVVIRNYRCPFGEIDIVARDGDWIAFVEVKSRTSNRCGLPKESVNYRKQQKLRQLAAYYLQQQDSYAGRCRFDVVGITMDKSGRVLNIDHVKHAF